MNYIHTYTHTHAHTEKNLDNYLVVSKLAFTQLSHESMLVEQTLALKQTHTDTDTHCSVNLPCRYNHSSSSSSSWKSSSSSSTCKEQKERAVRERKNPQGHTHLYPITLGKGTELTLPVSVPYTVHHKLLSEAWLSLPILSNFPQGSSMLWT